MREVVYTDAQGRKFKVLIPDSADDSHAKYGIIVGPPELTSLKLDLDTEVRLNNQLFARGIFDLKGAQRNRQEIFAALQAAFALDTDRIVNLYRSNY